ncbi:NmrA-like domain-containing protein, partial [Staphylotrichum tortipilum]
MASPIEVGVIGGTGKTGGSIVNGLLSSLTNFSVTSFTRESSLDSQANQDLLAQGVKVVGYSLDGPEAQKRLVKQLQGIDVLFSCMIWEHLEEQLPWIKASKTAGIKRFVPSEWVDPAPRGVIDIKDKG